MIIYIYIYIFRGRIWGGQTGSGVWHHWSWRRGTSRPSGRQRRVRHVDPRHISATRRI